MVRVVAYPGDKVCLDASMEISTMPLPTSADHWDQLWLPLWPLASNDLHREGLRRMARPNALEKRYLEANPKALSNLLVIDIDHSDAALRAVWDAEGMIPNVVVENPANGHAHAVWVLASPFARTEFARRKPLAFAAAVTEGLRRRVDGDKGYSGLITKNPGHETWNSEWYTDHRYTLGELAEKLTEIDCMPPASWARTRRKAPVGLGRNCSIFETVRVWAYREIRNHFGDPDGLHQAISNQVHFLNSEFSEPLTNSEAQQIAKSISHWITTESRMWAGGATAFEASFIAIQSARGQKSGKKRTAEKNDRLKAAKENL